MCLRGNVSSCLFVAIAGLALLQIAASAGSPFPGPVLDIALTGGPFVSGGDPKTVDYAVKNNQGSTVFRTIAISVTNGANVLSSGTCPAGFTADLNYSKGWLYCLGASNGAVAAGGTYNGTLTTSAETGWSVGAGIEANAYGVNAVISETPAPAIKATTTVTETKPATSTNSTPTTVTTAKPLPVSADLVVGFLDPTLSFENGVFVRHVSVTQHVLVKNRGSVRSTGGTVIFHFPSEALGPDEPTGDAVSGCVIKAETDQYDGVVARRAECALEPIASGETRELVITYKVKWGHVKDAATVYVKGLEDPVPHTAAQSFEIEIANPLRSSHVLKLGADYTITGSRTSNNPALK